MNETADDNLPRLSEVIERHGLSARKSLGQNFLLDLSLTRRIARTAGTLEGFTVIEVGPGPGGLTRALLLEGADKVVAVERDERALPALDEISAAWPGKLTVMHGDALATDWQAIAGHQPVKIVANLPYNIATPLLTGWLTGHSWPPFWSSLTLMFQKEVAQRICAGVGDSAYGRLSIISQWRSDAVKMFDVSPKAFTPPPKVTSSIVHITPRAEPMVDCDVTVLEKVTAAAFGQRRKMLRSSLKTLGGDPAALITQAGLKPTMRAEEVDVAGFCRLAKAASA
ncbi:16S rRNA (adenine(1518)-N(6)/adenine(1519)-N(6))-dimethyltransferase RsmA [Anderseniella sp. Alg231-50]|uniref:16S rRNA (adenine(1518)-N(6)/adenine(1519)-N(6))- dimethyltransferase RsmA n=1 Tax=Anderseniella sp. Alg231-50 TaxID=1922226 RepID=UPI000D5569F8